VATQTADASAAFSTSELNFESEESKAIAADVLAAAGGDQSFRKFWTQTKAWLKWKKSFKNC
jgi:hypothetical protein